LNHVRDENGAGRFIRQNVDFSLVNLSVANRNLNRDRCGRGGGHLRRVRYQDAATDLDVVDGDHVQGELDFNAGHVVRLEDVGVGDGEGSVRGDGDAREFDVDGFVGRAGDDLDLD